MSVVIAIDAGTTGVRAVAIDERGASVGYSYREFTQHFPRPGWVEHDAAEIWTTVQTTLAELAGRLDETVKLGDQAGAWAARTVVLDSAGITHINSLGIREWMHLVARLGAAGSALVHERCAEALIEQMSFIPAVRGGGTVRSFHAPYVCPACQHEASMLIDVAAHDAALRAMQAPALPCGRCGAPMELADLPERLFAFLVT
jgi:anti-anti-sigma regulatory factor